MYIACSIFFFGSGKRGLVIRLLAIMFSDHFIPYKAIYLAYKKVFAAPWMLKGYRPPFYQNQKAPLKYTPEV